MSCVSDNVRKLTSKNRLITRKRGYDFLKKSKLVTKEKPTVKFPIASLEI